MPSYEQSTGKNKFWSVRFRETGEDQKRHQKRLSGFKTKRDARLAYEAYCLERDKAARERKPIVTPENPDNMYFSDLLDAYLLYEKGRVKESSYYDVENKIENRIRPYFEEKQLWEIKPATVLEWSQALTDEGYSYSYRSGLMTRLSGIYRYGAKYHDITDIMPKVDRPRNLEAKKKMEYWTPEEFKSMIEHVSNPTFATMFWTLYVVGCRRGEGAALTWNDIDTEKGTVTITKSITTKVKGATYKVTTPKNLSSNRTVYIPPFLCAMLEEHRGRCASLPGGDELTAPTAFVFGGSRPVPHSSLDHAFERAIAKAGVKPIRIHDLRHSCASRLLSAGVSIVAVSEHLGHADVELTLNTYAHMMPDDRSIIVKVLQSINE